MQTGLWGVTWHGYFKFGFQSASVSSPFLTALPKPHALDSMAMTGRLLSAPVTPVFSHAWLR